MKSDGLPILTSGGAKARVIMGTLWGKTAATTCHAETIYADIMLEQGGTIPVDADADERALMLVGGEAEISGEAMELYTLYVLKPGVKGTLRSATGEILSGANDLSARTSKQAETISETSGTIARLAQAVQVNSSKANEAAVEFAARGSAR